VFNPTQTDGDGDILGDACDNCPQQSNANQLDSDGDARGNVCDNCPSAANTNQANSDGDPLGDVCDNCPLATDPTQQDGDGDHAGDACDNCPGLSNPTQADNDHDGFGNGCDNCRDAFNLFQADSDDDYSGNVCDNCPSMPNLPQDDADHDGAGDNCDCLPGDALERRPPPVSLTQVTRAAGDITIQWQTATGANEYLVDRLRASQRGPSHYGPCVAQIPQGAPHSYTDSTLPPAGDAFLYLVLGRSIACGAGSLGFSSNELERTNVDAGAACPGLLGTTP